MKYRIRNKQENEYFTGKCYTFQGGNYPIFSKENFKTYKSLKVAQNAVDRLERMCNCNRAIANKRGLEGVV